MTAHDVGRAVNPLLLRGQIYGAALQGVGFALAEEMIFEEGKLRNPNFRDYELLTAPARTQHGGGRPRWFCHRPRGGTPPSWSEPSA